jgi:tRNA(Ile)-lysidine synthase
MNADPFQAWLDREKLIFPLEVRSRKPGERFCPLGMGGHSIKLADFMTNNRLPRRSRATWPLVVSGQHIVWVPGYRIGASYALHEETRHVIHLVLRRSNSGSE